MIFNPFKSKPKAPHQPLLLGHRGVRAEKSIPENSLASFDLALAQGCDGFEFDVRLSGNGQAVICHDPTSHGREVAAYPADELSLPTLRDVLTRYRRKAFLDIELKVPGLESVVAELLNSLRPTQGYVVSSFLPIVLQAIRASNNAMPLGLICETRAQLMRWTDLPIDYVIPHYELARQELIAEMKRAGKKIFVWTVNTPAEMQRLSECVVDGIITDNPKLLLPSRPEKKKS